jgi:hypothetical protein
MSIPEHNVPGIPERYVQPVTPGTVPSALKTGGNCDTVFALNTYGE